MTTSPESRAKALLAEIIERGTGGWRFAEEVEASLPLIAAAIREAENDKLDQVLVKIGNGFWVPESTGVGSSERAVWKGMEPGEMIETIRSLKHPKD